MYLLKEKHERIMRQRSCKYADVMGLTALCPETLFLLVLNWYILFYIGVPLVLKIS